MKKGGLLKSLLACTLSFISLLSCFSIGHAQTDAHAAEALIKRVLPSHAEKFKVEFISGNLRKDEFEIETVKSSIVLRATLNYNADELLPAWDEMMKAISACKEFDGFNYDLVDVTRQVLANYALSLHKEIGVAYQKKNYTDYADNVNRFIQLIDDLDKLLSTHPDFLLGPVARSCQGLRRNYGRKKSVRTQCPQPDNIMGRSNQPPS